MYHFDLYRFNDEREWLDAGFDELFNTDNICLVEWPERAEKLLPPADVDIYLAEQGEGRSVTMTATKIALDKLHAP